MKTITLNNEMASKVVGGVDLLKPICVIEDLISGSVVPLPPHVEALTAVQDWLLEMHEGGPVVCDIGI